MHFIVFLNLSYLFLTFLILLDIVDILNKAFTPALNRSDGIKKIKQFDMSYTSL